MEIRTNFATVEDLEKVWRELSEEEKKRAEELLPMASDYLRQVALNNNIDLDKKVELNDIYAKNVRTITLEIVKRVLTTPKDAPPADSWSQAANPYSETIHFTDPSSNIYLKKSEYQLLGFKSINGGNQISLLRGVR